MIWLLGGYMWIYVHRPFEVWPTLGHMQFERGYMFLMLLIWAVTPGKGIAFNKIHIAQLLFTLSVILTWMLSPYANHPGIYENVDNNLKVAVFYVLVVTTVRDECSLRLLMLMFVGAVGLYMGHSLWEFMHGRYQYRMGTRRMIGVDHTYCDPNALASTLLYSLPMTIPFWCERPRRVPSSLLWGYVGCVVMCILLTGSRAGFAGLVLLGSLIFIANSKSKMQAIGLGGCVGIVGLLVLSVALPEDLQNRYLTLFDSSRGPQNAQVSAGGRLDGFLWGIHVWNQSPLLGHGPGSFGYATGRGGQAHNLYGQVMSEMGLVGACALLLVVWCFWRNWSEARRLNREGWCPPGDFTYAACRGVAITVFLMLVLGWSGHSLFRYNWQWLSIFSGVAVFCLRQRVQSALEAGQHPLQEWEGEDAWTLEGAMVAR